LEGMRLSVPVFFLLWVKALTLKNLNYTVPEEQGPGTVIGNIAKDAGYGAMERGKKSNFRVLENSAPHLVDIDPESGLVFTKQRIDRETLCRRSAKCQLSMEVFANDKEICMVKIDIQDINDNSPSFPSDHVNIDISENAAAGTRFPLTIAHDLDFGENGIKTYQVTRDDYNTFSLDLKVRGDGTIYPELVVQRPLDREDQSHHTLLLTAIDGGEYPRSGSMQINVRVTDSNDNSPVFEKSSYVIEIPENSPPGKILIDLNATDQDEGSNGQVVYSFTGYASERMQDLFSIDPNTGIIKIQGEIDYEANPIIEFDVQAKDLGPNPIPGHCKLTVKVLDKNDNWPLISFVSVRQGSASGETRPWDVSLPLIVTLCIISVMLLAVMTAIAVKSKHQEKEAGNYNCRMAEYSNAPVGKGNNSKKKRINKSDIMLVQSEMEERDSASRMNVVSSPSLITSPICFDYQSPLPLTLPRSEVMYLKTTPNSLTVPRPAGRSSFAGLSAETPSNRMSVIQTDNFPSEPNYVGSRQPFVQSSTFKDAERASLRDSGHGDSDQADSDQDTNKGQQPLIASLSSRECRALGHSDRCWMPTLRVASSQATAATAAVADSGGGVGATDNRSHLFIPVGMETPLVETEMYGTISRRKTLSTFGKEQGRDATTILVANVKPYLKSQGTSSSSPPPLQETPSPATSPPLPAPAAGKPGYRASLDLLPTGPQSKEDMGGGGGGSSGGGGGGSDNSAYGPPDGQCSPSHTEMEEPQFLLSSGGGGGELRPKTLSSSSLIHSSVISQEFCGFVVFG
ncbi:hypothetical protein CRUP_018401, partial [Coryphaenoides rupestris]